MTFQLDTSGAVIGAVSWNSQEGQLARHREIMHRRPHGETIWSDLSPFTQGYIEALFASKPLMELPQNGDDRPRPAPGFRHLASETLARIIADCAAMEANKGKPGSREDGADCWAGRQEGRKPGDFSPHPFPPLTVQLGDDGKVRFA